MKRGMTRERIVLSAISLFSEYSFDHVTLQQLAEDVGISNGSIYSHFETKAEILDAIVLYIEENLGYVEPDEQEVLAHLNQHGAQSTLKQFICVPQSQNFNSRMSLYRLMYRQMFNNKKIRSLVEELVLSQSVQFTKKILNILMNAGEIPAGDFDVLAQLWTRSVFTLSVFALQDKQKFSRSFDSLSDFFVLVALSGACGMPVESVPIMKPFYKQRHVPEQKRSRILYEACILFAQNGYSETTMRQIAKACGIQVAGIYNHFSNKYAILQQLMEEIARYTIRHCTLSTAVFENCLELGDRRKFIQAMCGFNPLLDKMNYNAYRVMLREHFFHEEVRDFYIGAVNGDRDTMQSFLEEMVAAGRIPPCDCAALATAYIYNQCSLCIDAVLASEERDQDEYIYRSNALLVNLIMDGMQNQQVVGAEITV